MEGRSMTNKPLIAGLASVAAMADCDDPDNPQHALQYRAEDDVERAARPRRQPVRVRDELAFAPFA